MAVAAVISCWFQDFFKLMNQTDSILRLISPDDFEGDTFVLAKDIADYERSLASVRCLATAAASATICYVYIYPVQYWLTDTELRNLTAIYNPMKLQDLSQLFNLVLTIYNHDNNVYTIF